MKQLLIFSLLLFLNNTDIFSQNIITWSKEKKLEWNDFLAPPNEDIFAYAITSTKIEVLPDEILVDEQNNISNYKELTVVANFYKDHSWVLHKNQDLLKHEQLHFDIAELFAQKIRIEFKKLQEKGIANFDEYLNIYKKLYKVSRLMQREYDDETNHGIDTEANLAWENKIEKLIE